MLDPKTQRQISLQLFWVHLSALLKVLTRHGPERTRSHVVRTHDELVVEIYSGCSTSQTSEKRLTPRGT